MINELKQRRLSLNMTQAQISTAVGVLKAEYQQWEKGLSPVPKDKHAKIASIFGMPVSKLFGDRHDAQLAKRTSVFFDPGQNYGVAAFHFIGGGKPLLLCISEEEYANQRRYESDYEPWMIVHGMCNETVAIRKASIADMCYCSAEECEFGFASEIYETFPVIRVNTIGDWTIIEAIADGFSTDRFDGQDVARVQALLAVHSDEDFARMVSNGQINPSNVEQAKEKERQKLQRVLANSKNLTYRLSNGKIRTETLFDDREVYDAIDLLRRLEYDDEVPSLIHIGVDSYERAVLVNPNALDYLSAPTHHYGRGHDDHRKDHPDGWLPPVFPKRNGP
jgi:transcriptional regulator with XRE-family HTH domain